ncbi:MAG: DUF4118 domain-containing protein [Flavobacteriales bacterium]
MHIDLTARRSYGAAVVAVSLAMLLRALLDPVLGDHMPYYLFYFAVFGATALGGTGPGFSALFLGFLVACYFFAAPRYSLQLGASPEGAFRFLTIGGVIAGVGGWAHSRVRKWKREVHERQQQERIARKELEHTYSTLSSIGDGLIATDTAGLVTFMNEVAEGLSGWTIENARGNPIEEVFHLVNLHTRQPVPNSGLRALYDGSIMTLPEHSCLVGRNGTDHLISDSAAPIRDHANRIIGSVIVFRKTMAKEDAFTIQALHLNPCDSAQLPLTEQERDAVERSCRNWLYREWKPDNHAVRAVTLHGVDLIVREEARTQTASGAPGIRFLVSYAR